MKIAISSKGKDLEADVDPRFGRASFLLVVDADTLDVEVIDNNDNKDAFKGAGIQAAASVSEKGADVLMTGFCGPNAYKTLEAAGIKVVNDVTGTVRDAVALYKSGQCRFAGSANTEGHW